MKNVPQTHNNFKNYLLLLLGLFILLFITKNIYSNLQVALDSKSEQGIELTQKQETLARLNALKATLEAEDSEALAEIEGFLSPVSDTDLLEYVYDYAQDINLGTERVIIRNISIEDGIKSDTGFTQANVIVSALFSWEKTLFNFIDYLVDPEAKYRFYMSSFDYPMNESSGNIQVQLPLTLYYK